MSSTLQPVNAQQTALQTWAIRVGYGKERM